MYFSSWMARVDLSRKHRESELPLLQDFLFYFNERPHKPSEWNLQLLHRIMTMISIHCRRKMKFWALLCCVFLPLTMLWHPWECMWGFATLSALLSQTVSWYLSDQRQKNTELDDALRSLSILLFMSPSICHEYSNGSFINVECRLLAGVGAPSVS